MKRLRAGTISISFFLVSPALGVGLGTEKRYIKVYMEGPGSSSSLTARLASQ